MYANIIVHSHNYNELVQSPPSPPPKGNDFLKPIAPMSQNINRRYRS